MMQLFKVFVSLPDYSDIKKDSKRHEHFVSLVAVLESFLVGVDLPNEAELQGIFGRVSQEAKIVKWILKDRGPEICLEY